MAIKVRFGRAEDVPLICSYILQAGDGLFEFLLGGIVPGVDPKRLLRFAVAEEDAVLGFPNAVLAELDGDVAGVAISYAADDYGIPPILENMVPKRRLDQVRELLTSRIAGTWYLNTLAVSEKAQGHGIGRALLEFSADTGQALSYERMSLHVWADNPGALRLYHDAGFRSVRTIPVERGGQLDHSGGMLLLAADLPLTMADAA